MKLKKELTGIAGLCPYCWNVDGTGNHDNRLEGGTGKEAGTGYCLNSRQLMDSGTYLR